jgi:hypothetical protein
LTPIVAVGVDEPAGFLGRQVVVLERLVAGVGVPGLALPQGTAVVGAAHGIMVAQVFWLVQLDDNIAPFHCPGEGLGVYVGVGVSVPLLKCTTSKLPPPFSITSFIV